MNTKSATTPPAKGHTATPRKDPRKSILPWLGALGHTFFVIEEDDSERGQIYGGWRSVSEDGTKDYALQGLTSEKRQLWQRTGKASWKNITPKWEISK